jgi:tetratricopeptide (TPR) repeat protein
VRRAVAIAAVVCTQLPTAGADVRTQADQLYETAGADFKAGRFQDAIKGFRQAYDLVRDPVYLFNLAQAYRKIFDCVGAAEHYKRFLADAKDVDKATRASVEQWIGELAPCVEQRTKEAEATRRYEEADKKRRADVAARLQRELVDRDRNRRRMGVVIGGVGGGLIVAGGLFGLRARRIGNELREKCMGCDWPAEFEEKEQTAERSDLYAIASVATGTAAVITGIVIYLRGRRANERVLVAPTPNGATVSVRF